MNKITNFILSKTEPPKESGWLKPLDDGSYGMYVFSNKGWTCISNPNCVTKKKGWIKIYSSSSHIINDVVYPGGSTHIVYTDIVNNIKCAGSKVELYNVKLSTIDNNDISNSSLVFNNVDISDLKKGSDIVGNARWGYPRLIIEGDFDTHNITDMSKMFSNWNKNSSVNLRSLDTSNVTDMSYMFSSCFFGDQLSNVAYFDTHNVTNMLGMFMAYCNATELYLSSWDTKKVENMSYMFYSNSTITTLYLSDNFNTKNVKNMSYMFDGCSSITKLYLGKNFGMMKDIVYSVDFSSLTKWTGFQSGVNELVQLYDRKANGMGVITLRLSSATKSSLGEAGITTLTNKGYTIA